MLIHIIIELADQNLRNTVVIFFAAICNRESARK